MSHLHRARIRHHIVPLIHSRRGVAIELPDGRKVPGHLATKVDTPPGTVLRWQNGGVGRIDLAGTWSWRARRPRMAYEVSPLPWWRPVARGWMVVRYEHNQGRIRRDQRHR